MPPLGCTQASVTLCPLTSTLLEAVLVRISVNPSRQLFTVPTAALGAVVGILESRTLTGIIHAMEMDCPRRPHEHHTQNTDHICFMNINA